MSAAGVGRIFYVDATGGSDDNTGLYTNQAWQTITKINSVSFLPGDRILFKRGETFVGQTSPNSSGTAHKCITYGAYGSGNRPVINGAASTAMYIESSSYHHLRFENIDFSGSTGRFSTVFCYNTHDIYFYDCIMRDAAVRHGVSINSSGTTSYNITVDTCVFHDNYMSGLLCSQLDSYNMLIKNCTSYSNGHDTSGDHGFYIAGGTIVENSTAYSNAAAGFKLNDNESEAFLYPIARNNISYSNHYGITLTHKNATIYNNLVYGNTTNLHVLGNAWGGYKVYFNTFVNSTSATTRSIVFAAGHSYNSEFKNNLFIQDLAVITRGNLHFDVGISGSDYASMFDYNTYYMNGSTSSTSFMYSAGDVGDELQSWSDWISYGAETHGTYLSALPDFAYRYSDLQPMDDGNLVGLGVALDGYATDYNGVTRTSPPTPGCYDDPKPEKVYFLSGVIGAINNTTVAVTFTSDVYASNYSTGVTIKVNSSAATISSATRQADTTKVYYVLSAAVAEGDTVTWEYDADTGSYSNIADTWHIPDTSAQSITNSVLQYVIDIDLEDGTTNGFDSIVSDDVSAAAGAALNSTSYGLQVVIDDTTATYGVKSITASETGVVRARFYLDPNTITMGANNTFTLLALYNSSTIFGELELNYNGGYAVMGRIRNDAAGMTETSRIYFADAPRYAEVKVTRASSDVASDGRIDIWINGASQQSVTGVDNYDTFSQFTKINWGATSGVDSGTSGTFYMDELLVNTSGDEIGA